MKTKYLLIVIIILVVLIGCKSSLADREKETDDIYDTFYSNNHISISMVYKSKFTNRTSSICYVDMTDIDYKIYNRVTTGPQIVGFTEYFKINRSQYYDYIEKIKELSCKCDIDSTDISFDCYIKKKGKYEYYIISKNNIMSCINYHNNLTKDTLKIEELIEYIKKYYNPKYEF